MGIQILHSNRIFQTRKGDSVCLRACPKTIHVGTLVFYFYAKKWFETAKEIVKR
ncbi:hypothetical protein LEP1GSC070_0283 [Leptospira santarosai str. AIM]|nr:hypothetical protein LEP1GSC070_0283 [Leptospira santarosai str. AIM]